RSLQAQALLDVERYGFTARESEIWLRRKAQVPYRDIAQELFITVNTVKKHVKNIRVKVEDYRFRQEMRMAN
ncbi:MAG: helix-turn-helix transcriptional regulator, partial [Cyanobacteria bacterium P01_C01_bin.73]